MTTDRPFQLQHRQDIQGLRAIAITSVVLYHAVPSLVPGGFVGVDVFFVISGFLITTLLARELAQTGSIDILAFYERRARRLLPAFFLVLCVTLVLSYFLIIPAYTNETIVYGTALYSIIFASNLYIAGITGDYFSDSAHENPLLHTWSLGVEEQFYLCWPLLLIAAWPAAHRRRGLQRRLLIVIGAIVAISFLVSLYLSFRPEFKAEAFFHPYVRFWELGAGAALALVSMGSARQREWTAKHSIARHLAIAAGLLLIAVSAFAIHEGMPFPGVAALLPVLGTVLVIHGGGAGSPRWAAFLWRPAPVQAIGKWSYGYYLWHWPLLAAGRAFNPESEVWSRDIGLCILSLVLAALTHRIVEEPFHRRRIAPSATSLNVLATTAAAMTTFAVAVAIFDWLPEPRFPGGALSPSALAAARLDYNERRERCHAKEIDRRPASLAECTLAASGSSSAILLWGDSHAEHLVPMVDLLAQKGGVGSAALTKSGCDAIGTLLEGIPEKRKRGACAGFNRQVMAQLLAHKDVIKGVVLSSRWVKYSPDEPISLNKRNKANTYRRRTNRAFRRMKIGLRNLLEVLEREGFRVVVVAPIPEQVYNPISCLATRKVEDCSVGRARAESFRASALAAIAEATTGLASTRIFDPFPLLCDMHKCPVSNGEIVLFRDADHLTASGARSLEPAFREHAEWLVAQ